MPTAPSAVYDILRMTSLIWMSTFILLMIMTFLMNKDLMSCLHCMHPGMVMPALTLDQINNDRRVEEEWNLLRTEQSDEENEDSDDGDRINIIKKTNLLFSAQRATAL